MKVLIIGFGSIGKRHYENFKSLGANVFIYSRRPIEGHPHFTSLEECLTTLHPTHVVIANETSEHGQTLDTVLKTSVDRVLVEKPLYSFIPSSIPVGANNRVTVAYNLRFHPMIKELKQRLSGKKIIGWQAYVGQHLSSWRPGRDYTKVYSASRELGGGPLRDLSHEIDLFRFFVSDVKLESSHGGHFSNIQSTAEDTFSLLLSSPNCRHANIHMNCIDHLVQRFMTVHTDEETFYVDLISGRWRDSSGEKIVEFDKNASYLDLAQAFLNNDSKLCSFKEGLETNKLIEAAEKFS